MSTQPTHSTFQPQSQSTSSSRPPVTLGQTTHLDPGAYARGTHAITLGEHNLVHPRAQLVAVHGPVSIGDRCIISEKCVIGGPVAASSSIGTSSTDLATRPPGSGSTQPSPLLAQGDGAGDDDDERDPVKTTISSNVFIHASSHIHAGATIKDAVVIEPHVTVLAGVTVGSHAKICAGITVDRDVDDWTVVYGNGDVKRRRKRKDEGGEDAELVENLRLKAMDKEREGTVTLFRLASRMASAAKKK